MAVKRDGGEASPADQLKSFIDRLDPRVQRLGRAVRAAVRKRFPTANELAYDYPDSVVITYSPTDKGIDGIVSIAARTDGVRLYFKGVKLPDPKRLLLGSGKVTRYIPLTAASQVTEPDVEALIAAAIDQSSIPLPTKGKGSLIIRTDAAKRRAQGKPKQ